jgi:hypothetical protein
MQASVHNVLATRPGQSSILQLVAPGPLGVRDPLEKWCRLVPQEVLHMQTSKNCHTSQCTMSIRANVLDRGEHTVRMNVVGMQHCSADGAFRS